KEPEALEILLVAQEKPGDRYIDLVREQSLKTLQPYVEAAVAAGLKIEFKTRAGARYFLRTVSTDALLKMEKTPGVCDELLFRPGVRDEARREALEALATLEKKPALRVLVAAIAAHDEKAAASESVAFDLLRLMGARPAEELKAERAALEKLATSGAQAVTRQMGYVALIAADGSADKAWVLAEKSPQALGDLCDAVPMVRDPAARAALFPRLLELLDKVPGGDKRTGGRYVRIELPGRLRTLTLAEVEAFADGINVARKGKATQHSTSYGEGGQTHTREGVTNPWWEVDLGREFPLERIAVWNRTDGNLGDRLKGWTLIVKDGSKKTVWEKKGIPTPEGGKAVFDVGTLSPLKLVRRAAMKALTAVRGKEAETVKALSRFVKDEGDRHAAIQALQRVPARLWPEGAAKPVLDDLLAFVKKVPAKERTSDAPLDALQLADGLAGLLPADDAKAARRELNELGVRVLRVGTLVEQMLFDKERLVVQAGKPVEIVFENTDTMPHNFVVVQPGSLEAIGDLAEKTAQDPKAAAREFVPPSPKVILGSKLLQPRGVQKIAFTAPAKAGVYPYVCTYPGHWRRMHGALYVVESLEEYQAGPEAYLAKHPPKIEDELLKFNRPRKEWKLEELAPAVVKLEGRSFSAGKQMFTVAACVSCHKFGGEGQEFGPDLLKLDPKWKNEDVVKHLLDPSLKIDDKYRTWTLRLKSGAVVTGMILSEKDGFVEVIENPLVAAKPRRLRAANIEMREPSNVSPMPKGLLDKLTREEALDLLAYVLSGANPKHRMFGSHGH
ncbi:MAG: c-type cytochrome, partial [Gemmataceae bacterium]|nr:c-type cytochrome [Gemmataceae bacterium]